MNRQSRIELLAELGDHLLRPPTDELEAVIQRSHSENQWFTPENTRQALAAIAENFLQKDKLEAWADGYPMPDFEHPEKTVGLVMAGNLPLVGFHDWLCVFVAGHRAQVKLSDKDKRLLPFLVKKMGEWAHESWEYTHFLVEDERLGGFDAVIATGSNNSARYFTQYFGKYPHIIRRNRNAVAILDGSETPGDFEGLGRDIFSYFGLGCRNVSKLYVPRGFDFEKLMGALESFHEIALHNKYKNNFEYNFTLFILNQTAHFNNGCLLLREDESLTPRIASAHYEFYETPGDLAVELTKRKDEIQCVVGKMALPGVTVLPFGAAQTPGLSDYADGVDTMGFLVKISAPA